MKISFFLSSTIIIVWCVLGLTIRTHSAFSKATLLESSSSTKPGWIDRTPAETEDHLYFVGEAEDIKQESAEEKAKLAMLRDYAFYLGADIRVLEEVHREEIKKAQEEIYHTQGKVISKVDALVRIYTTGCRFIERYWEKWGQDEDKDHYSCWVLGEVGKEFAEEERARIKASEGYDKATEDFSNSDLTTELRTNKDKYTAGDTVVIFFRANDSCFAYLLDFYDKGKVDKVIDSYEIGMEGEYRLTSIAKSAGTEIVEILKLIVADKPLDVETAISKVYPGSIIDNLRTQADSLDARYAEKSETIIIEPR